MAKRVCLEPGCPELIDKAASRCHAHERAKNKARGTRQQRGYDAEHDHKRDGYQRRMTRGETFRCWRCGDVIDPNSWDLGHDDSDRTLYKGPECLPCNRATASRR